MTDSDYPSISLCNLASHRAVEKSWASHCPTCAGAATSGLTDRPWEEFDWIGQDVPIGERSPACEGADRTVPSHHCKPETGKRDADTLASLNTWDHQNFGVYAEVVKRSRSVGDRAEVH